MENESLKNFVNEIIKKESESEEAQSLKELQKILNEINPPNEEVYMISFTTPN